MESVTIDYSISFDKQAHGRKVIQHGDKLKPAPSNGRVPRLTHLMALAIYLEKLIDEKVVADYADIARLGYVSRARLTQIMNLRLLAPDIQETILDLPLVEKGRDPTRERAIRDITLQPDWDKQRRMWKKITGSIL